MRQQILQLQVLLTSQTSRLYRKPKLVLIMLSRRIPPEVLFAIFMECLDTGYWEHRDGSIPCSSGDAPYLFLQICHQWRAVAMSTPRLWSNLFLPDLSSTPERCASLFSQVPVWLSLSRALPLSFVLQIKDEQPGLLSQYITLLQKDIHRWREVILETNYNETNWLPVFELGSFPLLTEFTYDGYSDDSNTEIPTLMTALASAPRLCHVDLTHDLVHDWVLPWENLSTLRLDDQSPNLTSDMVRRLCDNLGKCIRLEDLNIAFEHEMVDHILPPTSHIVLPHLFFFGFGCSHPKAIISVMHTLVTPHLRNLTIIGCNEPHTEIGTSILTFLKCSGSAIGLFDLKAVHAPTEDVARFLEVLPQVYYLCLTDECVDVNVFEALTLEYDDDGQLVSWTNPHLEFIRFLPHTGYYSDSLEIEPIMPSSMRTCHHMPECDTPDLITFEDSQPPCETGVSMEQLEEWFYKVSDEGFCEGFARMVLSRRGLPTPPLVGVRFVHFDLHLLERVSPELYTELVEYWEEGLHLVVWCSPERAEYWRSRMI